AGGLYGDDAQIHVGAEAAVEAHLVGAGGGAEGEGGEVEEAEVHRLLQLVGVRTGQHDPGDVGLVQPEAVRRVRVSFRPEQGLHDGGEGPLCSCSRGFPNDTIDTWDGN